MAIGVNLGGRRYWHVMWPFRNTVRKFKGVF
jgi:hypothetical protein